MNQQLIQAARVALIALATVASVTDVRATAASPGEGEGDKPSMSVSVMQFMTPAQRADATSGAPTFDATSVIQQALESSLNVDFGGPRFTYRVSGTMTLRDGQTVNTRGASIRQYKAQTPIFNCSKRKNITIEDSVLIGMGTDFVNTPSSIAVGIQCNGASGVVVRGNRFENFAYAPFWSMDIDDFKYIGNTVKGPGSTVLKPGVSRNNTGVTVGGKNILIANNVISETGQGLIVAETSQHIVVTGNVIHDIISEHGMYFDAGLRNLTVTGNTIVEVYHTGLKVQHYDAVGIEPNTILIAGNSIEGTKVGDCILMINSVPQYRAIPCTALAVPAFTCRRAKISPSAAT